MTFHRNAFLAAGFAILLASVPVARTTAQAKDAKIEAAKTEAPGK